MEVDNKKALSLLRLEKASIFLNDAKLLLDNDRYFSAANRSYYAVFHAMRSVLALDGIDRTKHSGVMEEFRKRYIKTGVFEVNLSKIMSVLSAARNDSDYDDFFVINKEEVTEAYNDAVLFLSKINSYLNNL